MKNDGGSAFPITGFYQELSPGMSEYKHCPHGGMSLRQWYAGMALTLGGKFFLDYGNGCETPEHISAAAFDIADAMLAEGEK